MPVILLKEMSNQEARGEWDLVKVQDRAKAEDQGVAKARVGTRAEALEAAVVTDNNQSNKGGVYYARIR
ncbi:MAG: hypothetical protein JRI91_10435 [Deltaproteobacteria bacterium]|nr:hypothetical protein [Deltaproteobacteria bacterium]